MILVFLFIFFYIAIKLSEQVGENYLQSHFHISLDSNQTNQTDQTDQTDQKIILPSQNFYSTLELKTETNDNYLDITLSGGDVFKVEFLLDDKSDFILISTIGNKENNYLYFIPNNITTRGYNKIRISPIRGDGDYWLQSINTYKDPDFNKFPTHVIVDFEIKKIEIEIEEDELAIIEEKRMEALQLGILLSEDDDYVPAIIYANGKKDDIEIRLKGDWAEHLQEKKWSFRIKMDDEFLWGMKKFSIQRPETRNGVAEYLIHAFYRNQGGAALRYEFVDVIINGEYWGVYALEEFFNKQMIENSLRREGPIIKPNEDYLWERWAYYFDKNSPHLNHIEFDVFGLNNTLEDETLSVQTGYAITLLNKLFLQEIEIEDVFDLDIYARYLASVDLFYACHGNTWHNMRYYFNPITAKLEPISFDEEPLFGLCLSSSKKNDPLINLLFDNEDFVSLYVHYLEKNIYAYDAFIEDEQEQLKQIEYIFRRDGVFFENFS